MSNLKLSRVLFQEPECSVVWRGRVASARGRAWRRVPPVARIARVGLSDLYGPGMNSGRHPVSCESEAEAENTRLKGPRIHRGVGDL